MIWSNQVTALTCVWKCWADVSMCAALKNLTLCCMSKCVYASPVHIVTTLQVTKLQQNNLSKNHDTLLNFAWPFTLGVLVDFWKEFYPDRISNWQAGCCWEDGWKPKLFKKNPQKHYYKQAIDFKAKYPCNACLAFALIRWTSRVAPVRKQQQKTATLTPDHKV